jgi:hypothetical protein
MRVPSLKLLLSFWIISNVLVILWLRFSFSDYGLSQNWRALSVTLCTLALLSPLVLLHYFKNYFHDLTRLGLLVCCCLAVFSTIHEANLLREAMQVTIDHDRSFLTSSYVEAVIRPLVSYIVDGYSRVFGDDHTQGITTITDIRSGYFTHIIINYMFDSLTFLSVFALATILLSPTGAWICLFIAGMIAQTAAMHDSRMGNVFLAGGVFFQLFLLMSGRYKAAIISGLIISFGRSDTVFTSAFAILGIAYFDRRWPSKTEWRTFAALIGTSIVVPALLIFHHRHGGTNYQSFLITQGDPFTKMYVNIITLRQLVGLSCPMLAIIIAASGKLSRTAAVVIPPALAYLGIVFLIADFTETAKLGPMLMALGFVCADRLESRLQEPVICKTT